MAQTQTSSQAARATQNTLHSGTPTGDPNLGSSVAIGLAELAILLVLPLVSTFTRSWKTALAMTIVMGVFLCALAAWTVVLLLRSKEWIFRAPAIFFALGSLGGLGFQMAEMCRMISTAGRTLASWPLFDTPHDSSAQPFVLSAIDQASARTWFSVSVAILAALLIAGFLYEMFRRDRSSLIISLGTTLVFGAAGWCSGGWLYLPLTLAAFSSHSVLLFIVLLFVFTIALLGGVRMACASPGSLPRAYCIRHERSVSIVLATSCLGLLGMLIPLVILL